MMKMTISMFDIIQVTLVVIVFMIALTFHRICLYRDYTSIPDILYLSKKDKSFRSSVLRTLLMVAISIFFYVLKFPLWQVAVGFGIGSFLKTWPAVVNYKLITIYITKYKILLLCAYAIFTVYSVLVSCITYSFLIPALLGKSLYILDNDAFALLVSGFAYVAPIPIENFLIKKIDASLHESMDSTRLDLKITIDQMDLNCDMLNNNKYDIEKFSKRYGIDETILQGIILLEYINRKTLFFSLYESLLCRFLPRLAINKDISVGLCQIKISTAMSVTGIPPERLVRKLSYSRYNIKICAKHIKNITEKIFDNEYNRNNVPNNDMDYIRQVALMYTTGMCEPFFSDKEIYANALINFAKTRNPMLTTGNY